MPAHPTNRSAPTLNQLKAVREAASKAYDRISNTVAFDPNLDKMEVLALGSFVSRAEGALLDLIAEIEHRERQANRAIDEVPPVTNDDYINA